MAARAGVAAIARAETPFGAAPRTYGGSRGGSAPSSTRGNCTTGRGPTSTGPTVLGIGSGPVSQRGEVAAANAVAPARTPTLRTTSVGTPHRTATSLIAFGPHYGNDTPSRDAATGNRAGLLPNATAVRPAAKDGTLLVFGGSTTCGARPTSTASAVNSTTAATVRSAASSRSRGTFVAPSSQASRPTLATPWSTDGVINQRMYRQPSQGHLPCNLRAPDAPERPVL